MAPRPLVLEQFQWMWPRARYDLDGLEGAKALLDELA
jgi:hypothetical protein